MDSILFIESVEERSDETVYWVEDEAGKRQFGIIFDGPDSVPNQHTVESILLAIGLAQDMLDELEEELDN